MNKQLIISKLESVTDHFIVNCSIIPDDLFFRQPPDKWSIAQNVTHLTTSASMTKLAYSLPKFMVRLYSGRPNRQSRNFDELVEKYKLRLSEGGKASGRFVPKSVPATKGKDKILNQFKSKMNALRTVIETNWKDEQLDEYIIPHPLLGKITLRELGYFTIYHTNHHRTIIQQRLTDQI